MEKLSDDLVDKLRQLGNPYAKLSILADTSESESAVAPSESNPLPENGENNDKQSSNV